MSEGSGLSLRDLLPERRQGLDEALGREIRADPAWAQAHVPAFAAGFVADKAADAVRGVLDGDLVGVLASAWGKARELHAYADPTKHPPEEVATLFLGEHALAVDLHPTVDVRIGGVGALTLRLTLTLAAELRTAQLTIHRGRITGVGACDGVVSAQLLYGKAALHEKLKPRPLTLTRSFTLPAPGLAIA